MLKNWRLMLLNKRFPTNSNESDVLLIAAISEVSVSIFLTSLTDVMSFFIGTTSDFIAVRKSFFPQYVLLLL